VGFVVCSGVAGIDPHRSGKHGVGDERGHADGVGEQLGLGVQDLLAWVDRGQWQAGRDRPVCGLGAVQVGLGPAEVGGEGVVGRVGDQHGFPRGWGQRVEQGGVGAGQCPLVGGAAARSLLWAFFLPGLGTIRVGSSSVVAYASWESRTPDVVSSFMRRWGGL